MRSGGDVARAAERRLAGRLLAPVLRHEQRVGIARTRSERLVEYGYCFRWLAQLYPESLLDVGPGMSSFPHLLALSGLRVKAIDEIDGYWRGRYANRHWHVDRGDISTAPIDGRFDCVTCISTLEHIPNADEAISRMIRLLEPNGHLILTFPFKEDEYVPNAYALPGATYGLTASYITQQFSRANLDAWLARDGAVLVDEELYRCFTGPYWTQGEPVILPRRVGRTELHQLACIVVAGGA